MSNKVLLSNHRAIGFIIALCVIVMDQFSKYLVASLLDIGDVVKVFGFLNIVHVTNTGISFGMLNNGSAWQLAIIYLVIFIACIWLFFEYWFSQSKFHSILYSLIIGGAVGNILDRIFRGAVVDFLDFYIKKFNMQILDVNLTDLHWPAFNVADAAIVVGVLLLCVNAIFGQSKKRKMLKKS